MTGFHPFNATGAPGSCLWCGRTLRQKHYIETEATGKYRRPTRCYNCAGYDGSKPARFVPTDKPEYFQCANCGVEQVAERVRRVVSRRPVYDQPGDYGDGYFCGLRCAYQFAVRAALGGTRLVRAKRSA